MGHRAVNFTRKVDYATGRNDSCIELHMELPLLDSDIVQVDRWLRKDDGASIESYLVRQFPQHRSLLTLWISGAKARKQAELREVTPA